MANWKGRKKLGVEFWRAAVERLQAGENAKDLAGELGIDQRDRSGMNREGEGQEIAGIAKIG